MFYLNQLNTVLKKHPLVGIAIGATGTLLLRKVYDYAIRRFRSQVLPQQRRKPSFYIQRQDVVNWINADTSLQEQVLTWLSSGTAFSIDQLRKLKPDHYAKLPAWQVSLIQQMLDNNPTSEEVNQWLVNPSKDMNHAKLFSLTLKQKQALPKKLQSKIFQVIENPQPSAPLLDE